MNIRYLEILEAIAETGSFTGAAKKLYITQSAVSHAVAELEDQAGTALFERKPKGVSVTPCGQSLLEEARGILIVCRNLDRRIPHLEEKSPIHLVSSITIASFVLPQILNRFHTVYPDLQVFVKVASAHAVLDTLRHGDADLAFWEGTAPEGEFASISLGSYGLRAACSPYFSASGEGASIFSEPVSFARICQCPLLLREKGSAIRDTLDRHLSMWNLEAEPIWESVNSLALVKAAEAGLGITVLPEMLLADSVSAGRLRFLGIQENQKEIRMENQMVALYEKSRYITKPFQALLDGISLQFL